jgi:tetratricopeptide (TPR) repeat protein
VQHATSDEYNQQVTRLRKVQDWDELVRYCRTTARQVRKSLRDGTATDDDKRLRIQALLDLQITHSILGRPQEQLGAAQKAHRAARQVAPNLGALDDLYSYTFLARAYAANGQPTQAREMFLCACASVITRQQGEWLGNAFLDLAAFERTESNQQTAAVPVGLAEGISRSSKKVQRGSRQMVQRQHLCLAYTCRNLSKAVCR